MTYNPEHAQGDAVERFIYDAGERLEECKPDQSYDRLADIDFKELADAGKTTLLLDAEGTFVEMGKWEVDDDTKAALQEAREQGIENIAIVTNNRPKNETQWIKLAWWAEEIDADIVFTPLNGSDRKPKPSMINKALELFEVEPGEAVMIGDKSTADVTAGNRAGVHTIKVDRLGKADLLLDRILRRPLEKVLKKAGGKAARTLRSEISKVVGSDEQELDLRSEPPEGVVALNKIYGFGEMKFESDVEDDFTPEDAELEAIAEAEEQISMAYKVAEKVRWLGENHGGLMADVQTGFRAVIAPAVAYAIIKEKKALSIFLHLVGSASDIEKPWITMSGENLDSPNRKRGAKIDYWVDKWYQLVVGAALAYKGQKSWEDFGSQTTREGARLLQRRHYEKHHPELDLKAVSDGKASTAAVSVADMVSITFPDVRHEQVRDVAQHIASVLKWKSYFGSPSGWREAHEEKRFAQERLAEMQAA